MASISDVIDAVCETISSVTEWRCTGLTDQPNPPCVMVYLSDDDPIGEGDSYFTAFQRGVVELPIIASRPILQN